jgi:hypothetical protein
VRLGSQTPRICVVPPYVHTYGDEVNDFMASIGRPGDPWQREIVRAAFGVQDDGLWAAFELMVLVARQNGKGWVTDAIELGGLFLFREPLVLHSAHVFKTCRAAFNRLVDICENNDWLRKRVDRVSRSKGDEGIFLTDKAGGGSLEFIARTEGSRAAARGLTGSTTVFDEAFALTIGQYQAQTPTLSTIPNPRIVYTSTPPDEDSGPMPEDAMLPSVRRRGHRGDERTACFEWSPPKGYKVTATFDPDMAHDCNPAAGIRIAEWFLRKQHGAFFEAGKPEKYSTEHLGQWADDAALQWLFVPEQAWADAEDPESRREGSLAFAITMSPDRQWTSISVAGRRPDGLRHVEVAVSERGSGWLVEKIKAMRDKWEPCAIAIRQNGPEAALIPDLEAAKVELVKMSAVEVAQACGMLHDGIAGPEVDPDGEHGGQGDEADVAATSPRNVRHRGQKVLTIAVAGAVTRKAGASKTWQVVEGGVDTSPAEGAANALWAFAKFGQETYDPLDNIW